MDVMKRGATSSIEARALHRHCTVMTAWLCLACGRAALLPCSTTRRDFSGSCRSGGAGPPLRLTGAEWAAEGRAGPFLQNDLRCSGPACGPRAGWSELQSARGLRQRGSAQASASHVWRSPLKRRQVWRPFNSQVWSVKKSFSPKPCPGILSRRLGL
jgi:hypothetical protein